MTSRGWAILGFGLVLLVAGRVAGIADLIQIAVGMAVLVLAALGWIRLGRRHLKVERELSAHAVHRDEEIEVRITLRNPDPLPSPPLILSEGRNRPLGRMLIAVPPLLPRGEKVVTHVMRATARGRFFLGPLRVTFTDPFGIARKVRDYSDDATVVVYPRIHPIPSIRAPSAGWQGDRLRHIPTNHGEDFYGIRPYQTGDDPRKVHWRTTARLGSLMIREDEASGRGMVTVFLDDRRPNKAAFDFDWLVEAAASVIALYARNRFAVRLMTASGSSIPFGRGPSHYARLLEELAVVQPTRSSGSGRSLRSLTRGHRLGVLVVISGGLDPAEVRGLAGSSRGYQEVVVLFSSEDSPLRAGEKDQPALMLERSGIRVVRPLADETIGEAWALSQARRPWKSSALT